MKKKPTRTARFVAVDTLCRLFTSRLPVKTIFARIVQDNALSGNERNLAMQLVYGVLRNRHYLERIVQLLSKTPLRKIDPFILQTLVVGLYQLFFLRRIPESAAVNEMVECCKTAKIPKRLEGFVNGILRESLRQKDDLARKACLDPGGEPITNHPEWLVNRWRKNFGDQEALRICLANNREPQLVLCTNTTLIQRDKFLAHLQEAGIEALPGRYTDVAVLLPSYQGSITALPGYAEGFFQVQDEAAQLATTLLAPLRPGGMYLDGCAGLGGKTVHLRQAKIGHSLQIHAVEPDHHRRSKLRENMTRLFKAHNVIIHEKILQDISLNDVPPFDGVLIDAPCSGTGVTGRHPDIRWNRRYEDLVHYQAEQVALLHHAATLLAPGGLLVYATCSLEPEENQQVVDIFLASQPLFTLTDCHDFLPEKARQFTQSGCFSPHPDDSIDGFFAARMQCS